MKTCLVAIVSALILTGCDSMRERDNGSSMGTSGTGQTGASSTMDRTGMGTSSTGQPYGAPNNNTGTGNINDTGAGNSSNNLNGSGVR